MPKIKGHVTIMRSSRAALSSMGSQYAAMIEAVLSQQYEDVETIIINHASEVNSSINPSTDLVFLGIKQLPDCESSSGEQHMVWAADLLDDSGITYTGSAASAVALEYDKRAAKAKVAIAGLATTKTYSSSAVDLGDDGIFPLFMKPVSSGGGHGIGPDSVVRSRSEYLRIRESLLREFRAEPLIETYLPGREFSVAILREADSHRLAAFPIELVPALNHRGDRLLGRDVKSADTEKILTVDAGRLRDMVCALALEAFRALGARDYGRIDVRLDGYGEPHFIEANLLPGLHQRTSYFTKAFMMNGGQSYAQLIHRVVDLGMERSHAFVTASDADSLTRARSSSLWMPAVS